MHNTKPIADDVLISQCKNGSLKYQELLYKRFYGYAMGISLRYSFSRDDALEAVNDGFIKVFNAIKSYDNNKVFKAWLRAVIINAAIDRRRKSKKHESNMELEKAPQIAAHYNVLSKLNANDILLLMSQLPGIQCTVFNLYEIDGYDHEEIAKMLNIPASSSRVYLSRAKVNLRIMINSEAKGI